MPSQELKRIFQSGKMNRDLDDRLVPNGEYREALNVNIGRSEGSDIGAVENVLGNSPVINGSGLANGECIGSYRDNGGERIYFFVTSNSSLDRTNTGNHAIFEFNQTTRLINILASGDWLNFHTDFLITGVNFVDDLLFWTDNRNQPRKINVSRARNDRTYYSSDDRAAVAKFAPYEAPTVESVSDSGNESNFLQDKLPRFAYRWKFEDGEFSTISPFTPIVFLAPAGLTGAGAEGPGEIAGLINALKQVRLTVPTPSGFEITEVEFLYKETANSNVYIIDDAPVTDVRTEFIYNSQDPFRTLPGNQLTRVYDAVPRLAQSQEFAGGRIVYGNFLQNYNLPSVAFTVDTNTLTTRLTDGFQGVVPNMSVKSRRTYQVGVILADRYGRQSPVILSSSGNDTLFVDALAGVDRETIAQQLRVTFTTELPDWAYSYRIVVKQREQEYDNAFTGTGTQRSGDTVNKIPTDPTAVGVGDSRPARASVYVKINTAGTNVTNNDLIKVQSIDLANGTFSNPAGTVLETEPVRSDLDIFFETSTGGLVPNNGIIGVVNVDFYNCYLFNFSATAHIEINRLRAGFNEPFFDIGVKAYVVQENFAEERRFNTLIHSSGLFNSRTGINQVNQFNEGEGGITISLDPQDGSVQKLFAEDTQLIIWQEDKISRSPIDKDFIYSAEGGQVPVTSNSQYLGTISPYAGEYGISRDPASFAVYGTRKYFTDKNRGVVLRLSQDGLTEVSGSGMSDFFRDALRTSTKIVGSFDEYHDSYNITIIGDDYTSDSSTNIATASDGYFTLSFEEDVRGWSSFYSFEQESGTTLNNTYYTFNGGNLWEHNSEVIARNSFYGGDSAASYVEFIFNDNPSVVKKFKTLGYEGTAGWDCTSLITDIESFGTQPVEIAVNSATMQIAQGSSINNANIEGDRRLTGGTGATVVWTLRADPENSNFEFTQPAQFSIMNPLPTLVVSLTTISEGSAFITVSTDLAVGDAILPITVAANPVSSFVGNILSLNFLDNLLNTQIEPSFVGLSSAGFNNGVAPVSFVIRPDRQSPEDIYSFDDLTVSPDEISNDIQAVLGPLLVPGSLTETRTEEVITGAAVAFTRSIVTVDFMVSEPSAETTRSMTIDGDGPTLVYRFLLGTRTQEIRSDTANARANGNVMGTAFGTFGVDGLINSQFDSVGATAPGAIVELRSNGFFEFRIFAIPTVNFVYTNTNQVQHTTYFFPTDADAVAFRAAAVFNQALLTTTNATEAIPAGQGQAVLADGIIELTDQVRYPFIDQIPGYGDFSDIFVRGRLFDHPVNGGAVPVALTTNIVNDMVDAATGGDAEFELISNTGLVEIITPPIGGTITSPAPNAQGLYPSGIITFTFPAGTNAVPVGFFANVGGPRVDSTAAGYPANFNGVIMIT